MRGKFPKQRKSSIAKEGTMDGKLFKLLVDAIGRICDANGWRRMFGTCFFFYTFFL